jgi:phenylpyruvate tautomerase PptA (4-oxalocrotonate tautomerase family)
MPLVRIDVVEGRTPAELRRLADVVQEVVEEVFAAPPRDRYQVVDEHPSSHLILSDTGLGFERTDDRVLVQVFQQGGTTSRRRLSTHASRNGCRATAVWRPPTSWSPSRRTAAVTGPSGWGGRSSSRVTCETPKDPVLCQDKALTVSVRDRRFGSVNPVQRVLEGER